MTERMIALLELVGVLVFAYAHRPIRRLMLRPRRDAFGRRRA